MRPRKDRKTYFRNKSIVLTERDELAYSRVLREFNPGVKIVGNTYRPGQEESTVVPNIPHGDADETYIRISPPEEDERSRFYRELGLGIRQPKVHLHFRRSKWAWPDPTKKWAFDPPLLDWGEVWVAYPMGNEELKRFAGKLLRLVDKVTWKRGKFGLDACRWSQAGGKERRGLGSGILIDPDEKIELNKYYDDSLWDDGLPDEPNGVRVEY